MHGADYRLCRVQALTPPAPPAPPEQLPALMAAAAATLATVDAARSSDSNPFIGKKFYVNPANQAEYDTSNATATCSTKAALQEMRKTPSVRRRRRRRR